MRRESPEKIKIMRPAWIKAIWVWGCLEENYARLNEKDRWSQPIECLPKCAFYSHFIL